MQTLNIWPLAPIAIILSGGLASAQSNPAQIALLKWFPAYESATFGIGSSNGAAFDGANMWVANGTPLPWLLMERTSGYRIIRATP
jgi:hypothetical protein